MEIFKVCKEFSKEEVYAHTIQSKLGVPQGQCVQILEKLKEKDVPYSFYLKVD